jgi:hypothetical protein
MHSVIKNYNNTINSNSNNNQITVPQTTGITYNVGETSSNYIDEIENVIGFNPQPTKKISIPVSNNARTVIPTQSTISIDSSITSEHPAIFDEDVVQKCTTDAIRNSTKITEAMNTTAMTIPQTTLMSDILATDTSSAGISNTTIIIGIITLIIFLLIIGYLLYKYYSSNLV